MLKMNYYQDVIRKDTTSPIYKFFRFLMEKFLCLGFWNLPVSPSPGLGGNAAGRVLEVQPWARLTAEAGRREGRVWDSWLQTDLDPSAVQAERLGV